MGLLVPKGEDPEEKSKKLDPPGPIRLALKIWVLEKPVLTCLHIFLPFAIYNMHVMKDNDAKSEAITFLTCLLAVVPLAERLGYATEQVSGHTGEVAGGLLNASFGNVPELVVTIIAIKSGLELIAIQMLLGSLISCLLLVTGLSVFFGGLKHKVQTFNTANSSTLISMILIIATFSGLITMAEQHGAGVDTLEQHKIPGALAASRALAVVGMVVYIMYLVYSLVTHKEMFDEKGEKEDGEDDDDDDEPELSALAAICMMAALVALISYLSDGLVSAIDGAAEHSGIPPLILCTLIIPNVNNAPEHAVAILMAWNGQLDASIGISVGSAAQLAIFLVPFAILADWVAGGYIGFGMEPILAAGLAISALFAAILLSSGKCTWMHGVLLITTYAAIIGAFWLSASIGQKEAFSDSTVAWVIDLLKSATTSVRNKASQEALLAAHIHNASVKVHSATDVDAHDAHWVQSAMFIPGTIHAALRAQHAMQATS
jgi:Ca2+:H+ antiporter